MKIDRDTLVNLIDNAIELFIQETYNGLEHEEAKTSAICEVLESLDYDDLMSEKPQEAQA